MMRLTTFIRFLALFIVAAIVLRYGSWLAFAVVDRPDASSFRRFVAVAIVVLTFVPWLVLAGWAISRADEYARHIFLLGIALAMAGSMLVFTAFDFMRDTHMISDGPMPWFPIMVAMWAGGTALASGHYWRRR